MSSTTHLELVGVDKQYRHGGDMVRALDDVSLEIQAGEFVAVVGRSGSGKSTLLQLVGLLARPTAGKVLIEGVDTSTLGDQDRAEIRGRRIGFVFQEYNLLPFLDVQANVGLAMRYGPPDARDATRPLALLEKVGLADRRRHRPDQLSGGQQQRAAIARALVNRPALVLADEPTGALDSQTGDEILRLLRVLNRGDGTTIVVVTHDHNVASAADRVIELRDGRIASDSSSL